MVEVVEALPALLTLEATLEGHTLPAPPRVFCPRRWMTVAACAVLLLSSAVLAHHHPRLLDSSSHPAAGSEAHTLYARGRFLFDRESDDSVRKSAEYFRRAVALEPKFAAAWAGLADAYDVMAQFQMLPPAEGMAEARRAADKALELEPNLAEAHLAMAAIMEAYDWNWKGAEREYRKAIRLNPRLAAAHQWYGMFLRDQGRLKEAVPELEIGYRMAPLSVSAALNLAHAYSIAGDPAAAIRAAQAGLDLAPNSLIPRLCLTELEEGPNGAALIPILETARREMGWHPQIVASLASLYGRSGRQADAAKLLAELRSPAPGRYVSPYLIAKVYMAMDDPNSALPYLEQAYRERSAGLVFLRMSRYASNPGVRAIIDRLHMNNG
jgi:tetratricopeptide (TPR) repeat protein